MTTEPRLSRAIDDLCRRYGLAELYVFGSRAAEVAARVRGEEAPTDADRASSDVDMGVRPLPGSRIDIDVVVGIAGELERLLGTPRVDVVVLPGAKTFLALEVIRGELLYCADPDAQSEFELYVLRSAGDLAPFQRERQRIALSRYTEA